MKRLKLPLPSPAAPIDPLQIFSATTLRGGIEGIWDTQAEALRDWHRLHRDASDVVVQMSTGGGKTLVGLLMAQSLCNQTHGQVLYVCANNQLIQQTQQRAADIGLSPAIRKGSTWDNDAVYHSGQSFCITNYDSVFNGRSQFLRDTIAGIVFDDAHVAEGAIRKCFTLKISHGSPAFKEICSTLRSYYSSTPQASHFDDVVAERYTPPLFVPGFLIWHEHQKLRKTLLEHGFDSEFPHSLPWQHLKDHLSSCCLLLSRAGAELAPFSTPLTSLPYYAKDVRRLYLTATLPSRASFVRTFGISDSPIISPSGKSGDAQRLFVYVLGEDDQEQRQEALALVDNYKCCVISPSLVKGQEWSPPSKIYESAGGQEEIDRFSNSTETEMLGLVARYDGIDLPGKSCRVLVLDRLPKGTSLFDQFLDEGVAIETIRERHRATRIVQAIGRIFRSNTDHGIVLLVGTELQAWLRNPRTLAYLPQLLQQQIKLGALFASVVEEGSESWEELMRSILSGDANWDSTYRDHIGAIPISSVSEEDDWYLKVLYTERQAHDQLWAGQPARAADAYQALAIMADEYDSRLGAWYHHLSGLALLLGNNRSAAMAEFVHAVNIRSELGRPPVSMMTSFAPEPPTAIGAQAQLLADAYNQRRSKLKAEFAKVRSDLVYGPRTSRAEEATRVLATLIGLESFRPDKTENTGPDVVWLGPGNDEAWGLELKTNKDENSAYSKEEVGQCHDHETWLSQNHEGPTRLSIVGRLIPVSQRANPSRDWRVIELGGLRSVLDRAEQVFDLVDSSDQSDIASSFSTWLNHYGLTWPACLEALPSQLAIDLKDRE